MAWKDVWSMAWKAVWTHKLRALLTMLGLVIGVTAVIVLSAVGRAATLSVTGQVERLGSNLLTVFPMPIRRGGISVAGGPPLTYAMAQAIARQDFAVAGVAPIQSRAVQVVYGPNNYVTTLQATTAVYPAVQRTPVARGRFFTAEEVRRAATVCDLGAAVAQALFPPGSGRILGRTVEINGLPFTVIGVLAPEGSNGFVNLDDRIMVPITTAIDDLTGTSTINSIDISARSPAVINLALYQVSATLDIMNHQLPGQPPPYRIQNQATVLAALTRVTQTLTELLAGVAGISLLVGGIGIMNIMLVSVSERTREIGIRKAVGATRGAILGQFLTEAVLVSGVGAVLGLGFGGVATVLVAHFWRSGNLWSWTMAGIAIGVAVAIGVGFGVYPARKAAQLHPIDALRFD